MKGAGSTDRHITKHDFNQIFWHSESRIIRRDCPGCAASHQTIFYRRRHLDQWNAYSNFLETWSNQNNVLGVDFDLYSSLEDALSQNQSQAWTYCNYNGAGILFPYRCGPTGSVSSQESYYNYYSTGSQKDFQYYVYNSSVALEPLYFKSGSRVSYLDLSWSGEGKKSAIELSRSPVYLDHVTITDTGGDGVSATSTQGTHLVLNDVRVEWSARDCFNLNNVATDTLVLQSVEARHCLRNGVDLITRSAGENTVRRLVVVDSTFSEAGLIGGYYGTYYSASTSSSRNSIGCGFILELFRDTLGAKEMIFRNNVFSQNPGRALEVRQDSSSAYAVTDLKFLENHFNQNRGAGMWLHYPFKTTLVGNSFTSNGWWAVVMAELSRRNIPFYSRFGRYLVPTR